MFVLQLTVASRSRMGGGGGCVRCIGIALSYMCISISYSVFYTHNCSKRCGGSSRRHRNGNVNGNVNVFLYVYLSNKHFIREA